MTAQCRSGTVNRTARPSLIGAVAAAVLWASACSASRVTEATEEPADVALAATAGGIRFANHTDRPVYYTAFEREYAARVLFAPCTDAERCPAVAPGAQVTIPLSLVGGYEPGKREALVYWWHLTTGHAGGRIVEDMHSEVVRLPPSVP